MPTFPTFNRAYTLKDYSYEVNPDVTQTTYYSGNTRQRKHLSKNDDRFSVNLFLSDSELEAFESFVQSDIGYGADTFDGPYYTGGSEITGTLQIIEGSFSVENIQNQIWSVSYQFDVKDRGMTEEDSVYEVVTDLGSFSNTEDVLDALADMVNNNTL